MTAATQLARHAGERVELPGRYGPVAALRGAEPPERAAGTVLLIPGYTGSKEDFAPLLDGCTAAGVRAVAIDLPGQYESGGPDDESAYLPGPLGEVVAELADPLTAEGPVVLLGHSYGGFVARAAVLAGAPVAGLTLLDSGPACLPDGTRRAALLAGEPMLRAQGAEAVYDLRERLIAEITGHVPERNALRDFLRSRFIASAAAALLGMAQGLRTEPDRTAELAEYLRDRHLPALVVAGENDDAWSVASQREMAERLDMPFVAVEGVGHSPNTENPKRLLDIVLPTWREWLS